MKKYVISLKSALDRREHITQEFKKQNIEFEFFDAITPKEAQELFEQFFPNVNISYLSSGEIACSASHIMLWQMMLEQNLEHICVFEDDIFLGKNVEVFVNSIDWLPKKWDILKLETFLEKTFLSSQPSNVFGRKLYKLKGSHFGTAGYIICKPGAIKLMNYIKKCPHLIPIDHIMFSQSLDENIADIYQIYPAICIQEKIFKEQVNLSSDLEISRQTWHVQKLKLSINKKIVRELLRLALQIRKIIFAKIVPFI